MIRILIADDEELERKALRLILSENASDGVELLEARHGREAVERAAAAPLDAAFLDVRMPGIDGIEAARRIRAMRPDTPIVFLTAFDSFDYAREALRLGIDEYLLKPASAQEVRSALAQALRNGEARRAGTVRLAREVRLSLAAGELAAGAFEEYRSRAWPELAPDARRLALAFRLEPRRPAQQGPETAPRIAETALARAASLAERCLAERGWLSLAGSGPDRGLALALGRGSGGAKAGTEEEPVALLYALRELARAELGLGLLAGAAASGADAALAGLCSAAAGAAALARPDHPLVTTRYLPREGAPEPGNEGAVGSRTLERAIEIMAARLGEDISLESVASELRVSPSHLSRRLSLGTGAGFGEHLARMRVDRAKGLLAAGSTVKEAAALVGYHDPAYFARVFRRLEGESPAEYKERPRRRGAGS